MSFDPFEESETGKKNSVTRFLSWPSVSWQRRLELLEEIWKRVKDDLDTFHPYVAYQ